MDAGTIASATEIGTGDLTRGLVFERIDEGQVVAVLQEVPTERMKELLEFAFAERGGPLFAQVGGLFIEFDPDGTAQVLDEDGSVLVPGERIVEARLADAVLVQDGAPVEGGPAIALAVSERVRDGYPLDGIDVVNVAFTVAQGVDSFVQTSLGGEITANGFPVGGGGRIEAVASE